LVVESFPRALAFGAPDDGTIVLSDRRRDGGSHFHDVAADGLE